MWASNFGIIIFTHRKLSSDEKHSQPCLHLKLSFGFLSSYVWEICPSNFSCYSVLSSPGDEQHNMGAVICLSFLDCFTDVWLQENKWVNSCFISLEDADRHYISCHSSSCCWFSSDAVNGSSLSSQWGCPGISCASTSLLQPQSMGERIPILFSRFRF